MFGNIRHNKKLKRFNRKDMEDIPAEAREKLEFVWLEQVDDALNVALSKGADKLG